MLEEYIGVPRFLKVLRSGAAGRYVDEFSRFLSELGYNPWTGRKFLFAASHFANWAQSEGMGVTKLNEGQLAPFRGHLRVCRCARPTGGKSSAVVTGCQLFLDHLRQCGILSPVVQPQPTYPPLIEGFRQWMQQHRDAGESILELYSGFVGELLDSLGDEPSQYDAHGLRNFVFERARRCSIGTAKLVVTSVRMFLRYAAAEGKCAADLRHALPTLANPGLSTLPRYLPADDVERVVAACDDRTLAGARDRSIVLFLARLGLRASDIVGLRLDDIDWRDGSFCVLGKGRREVRLPLTQEIGDAVLTYLKYRPAIETEKLFITVRAPLRPLQSRLTVTGIVARSLRRAGVDAPVKGAHVLRHSAATGMLRQGLSLPDIKSVLRHSSIETTEQYAKVDLTLLKQIAQPWPEVSPCS